MNSAAPLPYRIHFCDGVSIPRGGQKLKKGQQTLLNKMEVIGGETTVDGMDTATPQ